MAKNVNRNVNRSMYGNTHRNANRNIQRNIEGDMDNMENRSEEYEVNYNLNDIEEKIYEALDNYDRVFHRAEPADEQIVRLVQREVKRKKIDGIRVLNLVPDENGLPKKLYFNIYCGGRVLTEYKSSTAKFDQSGEISVRLELKDTLNFGQQNQYYNNAFANRGNSFTRKNASAKSNSDVQQNNKILKIALAATTAIAAISIVVAIGTTRSAKDYKAIIKHDRQVLSNYNLKIQGDTVISINAKDNQ